MPVDGKETIVRAPDGIHLNERGSRLLAAMLLQQIRQDYVF